MIDYGTNAFICPSCRRSNDPADDMCEGCGRSFEDIPACVFTAENVKGVNPEFSADAHAKAMKRGDSYDVPRDIAVPAGTVYRGEYAVAYCKPGLLNREPKAAPLNDACRKLVEEWTATHDARVKANVDRWLMQVAEAIDTGQDVDETWVQWLKKLAIAYGRYNGELDAVSTPEENDEEEWDE